jgi:polyhydroxyalkanoate synthesis regulator phasin
MSKTEKNNQRRLRELSTKFNNLLRDLEPNQETLNLRKEVATLKKRLSKLEQQ